MQIHSTLDWEAHNIHNLQEKAKKCIKPCFNSTISFLQNDHINYLHIYNPGPTQSRNHCRRGEKTCSSHPIAAESASTSDRAAPRRPLEMQCVTWKCGDIQDLEKKQVLHLKWKRRERAEIPRLRRRHPHGPMQQECLSPREQEGTVGRRRGTLEGPQASQREGQTVPETPAWQSVPLLPGAD